MLTASGGPKVGNPEYYCCTQSYVKHLSTVSLPCTRRLAPWDLGTECPKVFFKGLRLQPAFDQRHCGEGEEALHLQKRLMSCHPCEARHAWHALVLMQWRPEVQRDPGGWVKGELLMGACSDGQPQWSCRSVSSCVPMYWRLAPLLAGVAPRRGSCTVHTALCGGMRVE